MTFKPVRWVVHHSASPGGGLLFIGKVAKERENIDYCPYHFVISNGRDWGGFSEGLADGMLLHGREDDLPGAHVHHHNSDSLGVCLIGDFNKAGSRPTSAQIDTLISLLVQGYTKYGIIPIYANPADPERMKFATVWNHKDMPDNSTDCPGDNMYDMTRRACLIAYEQVVAAQKATHIHDPNAHKEVGHHAPPK